MKKVIFESAGVPSEVLKVIDAPIPTPKKGEIRVKVIASNVNPSDVMFIHGFYGLQPKLPSCAGFEGVGTIDEVGEGLELPKGMRVSFTNIEGTWTEYAIVPANAIIPVPKTMPDQVAAQLFINPFTAFAQLHESKLKEGDFLLLTAGGSTFSQLVIQIAAKRGIKTICTVRRNDQISQLKELGAFAVINTKEEKLHRKVLEITNGKGVPCCMDAVGGDLADEILKCLSYGGLMLAYGMLSLKESVISNGLMIFKNLTIKGFWLSSWLGNAEKAERERIAKSVVTMLTSGELKLNIEATYPIDKVVEAVNHSSAEGRKGKILITMG